MTSEPPHSTTVNPVRSKGVIVGSSISIPVENTDVEHTIIKQVKSFEKRYAPSIENNESMEGVFLCHKIEKGTMENNHNLSLAVTRIVF